jgi:lysozyme
MRTELVKQLRLDEDERPCVYKDSLGFYTIGIGRLVDDRKPGAGLRPDEMAYMLNNDIDDRIEALTRKLPWFQDLDDARRGALLNMSFQLGVDGLLKFKHTLALIRGRQYDEAADAMLESLWAEQTPKRAQRMSDQIRSGKWVYAE